MPLAQHHMFPPASTLAIPGPLSFLPQCCSLMGFCQEGDNESPKCRILSSMGTLTPAMAAPSHPKSLVFSPPNLVRVFPRHVLPQRANAQNKSTGLRTLASQAPGSRCSPSEPGRASKIGSAPPPSRYSACVGDSLASETSSGPKFSKWSEPASASFLAGAHLKIEGTLSKGEPKGKAHFLVGHPLTHTTHMPVCAWPLERHQVLVDEEEDLIDDQHHASGTQQFHDDHGVVHDPVLTDLLLLQKRTQAKGQKTKQQKTAALHAREPLQSIGAGWYHFRAENVEQSSIPLRD